VKCDEFLPAMETGGPLRRWRARRHAARCLRCAAVLAKWVSVKDELPSIVRDPTPLTDWERSVWMRAAEMGQSREASPAAVAWRMPWPRVAGVLAAAACAVTIAVVIVRQKPTAIVDRPQPTGTTTTTSPAAELSRVVSAVNVQASDQAAELAGLSEDVRQLADELQALRRKAERNSARQQVALTLSRFERWGDLK
jgi:hypothetical protein